MADIFGDNTEALDVSDAALDKRGWESDGTNEIGDPVVEEAVEEEEVVAEEAAAEEPHVADSEAAAVEAAVESGEVIAADDGLPTHLKGKSPQELAVMLMEAQSHIGRQSNEVGDLRRAMDQMQQNLQLQQQQFNGMQQANVAEEIVGSADDPELAKAAYAQAIDLVDRGALDIGTVEQLIARTMDVDPKLANMMQRDFDRRLITAQAQQMIQQQMQQVQQQYRPMQEFSYQEAVRAASNKVYADPEFGDELKAYGPEVLEMLKGKHLGSTPQEIEVVIKNAVTAARGVNPIKSASYQKLLASQKQDQQVEEGSGAAPRVGSEQQIRDSVFKRKDPADKLFAGFGGK